MLFTVLYMSAGWLFQYLVQRRYQEAVFCNENVTLTARPWRATLAEEGATFSCDASVSLYRWPFIQDVFRTPAYICFVLTPLYRLHIPLRAFRDEAHLTQFLAEAKSHIRK
jgi:hypothetical protein